MEHLLLTACCGCGLALIIYGAKKIKLRYMILSALTGIAALYAADLICGFFNCGLAVNVFTLGVSALGGIPGVILLNILNAVLH